MDDLENIFAKLKLNADNSSDGDVEKYLTKIDVALKENETTLKWIDELGEEYPVTNEELNKLLDTTSKNDDDFTDSSKDDACALRYSVVEIIAKRCLQVEIKIQRNEFEEASKDALDIVKFINAHKAYYEQTEYMVGFRYVANCLAIRAQRNEIRKKNESKQVNVSRLEELLQSLNEYQHFGIHQQVGVLAIKQYFAGNLRKGSCHGFQLRIVREASVCEKLLQGQQMHSTDFIFS